MNHRWLENAVLERRLLGTNQWFAIYVGSISGLVNANLVIYPSAVPYASGLWLRIAFFRRATNECSAKHPIRARKR